MRRSGATWTVSRPCSHPRPPRSGPGAPLLVVVNDRRGLYPELLDRAGLRLDGRYRRHVNRRTGLRAGEYFEDVLVARPA